MRVSALVLVLVNIGYLVWHLWLQPPAGEAVMVRSPSRAAPARLTLLSEVQDEAREEAQDEAQQERARAGSSVEGCVRVGGFADTAAAEGLLQQVQAMGYQAAIETREVQAQPDYWVHLPPFASPDAAQQQLEELQAEDIDSYLIASGELAQGISLGLFSQREAARRLQEQVAAQGYQASITQVSRTDTEAWVNVAGLEPGGFSEEQWSALQQNYPGLRRQEKACETIAPAF